MITLELTEPMQAVRNLAYTYARDEIRPIAAQYDELEEMPWPFLKRAGESGLLSGLTRMELSSKAVGRRQDEDRQMQPRDRPLYGGGTKQGHRLLLNFWNEPSIA